MFVFWSIGLGWFYIHLIQQQTQDPLAQKTDAIVVLTGGSGRLAEGVSLLAAKNEEPRQLFISGVDKGVPIKELLAHLNLGQVDVNCCIALGYEATNTRENARETLVWMQHKDYQSMRLVTAHYHMPRSLMEFRRLMPNYKIVPHPIVPPLFKRRDWHGIMHQVRAVCFEYIKFLVATVRLQLIRWFPDLGLQ
ncbi:MAG: YdcF family protein [Pseudomonadota bacterium]